MASINDVVNQNLARVMANHGAPLRALAEREDRDAAIARSDAAARREFGQRVDLLDRNNAADTARALALQNNQQAFLGQQGGLNRQNQLDIAKAHAAELVSRLDAAGKAKLRVEFPLRKGETDEDWIKRVAETQGKNVTALYERQNKLDAEIQGDIKKETDRRLGVAEKQAQRQVANALDAPAFLKSSRAGRDALEAGKSYDGILTVLGQSKDPNDKDVAAQLKSFVSATAQELASASDERGRPLIPESPAHLESLKQKQLLLHTYLNQSSKAESSPDFYGEAYVQREAGMPPPKAPPGLDTAKASLDALNAKKPLPAGSIQPTVSPAPTAPATPRNPEASGLPPGVGSFLAPAIGAGRNVLQAGYEGLSRLTGNMAPAAGPTYGTISEQEKAAVANLFGPDAASLLPEAAKLASANGLSEADQLATYKAALGGDPDAKQKMDTMLNFVRSQKQSPDFVPVFNNMQEYPGTPAPSNDYFGPTISPAR